jgi:trehalose 6-phosphate synthase
MVIAAYRRYDVLFVNAIADGMNLVAKEGPLLNDRDGVLVLSERAGAHEQLAPFALGVEPLDIEQTAAQLERAIDLPAGERARRARDLRAFVEAHDVARWIDAQIDDLDELAAAR